ncbi:MAG: hypothetical protein IJT54_07850 [Candidatus Methanomethylophilaceae archaeon]|nr:hypothetical protein [Candidatus Methanomethylophilaceae archaeon]
MKDQSYSVFPLSDLVKDLGKRRTQEYLGTFRLYKDSDAGVFLSKKVLMMEDRDLSRTYLAMDSNDEIMGFISLGIKCLSIPEKSLLSDRMIQDMFIDPKQESYRHFFLHR